MFGACGGGSKEEEKVEDSKWKIVLEVSCGLVLQTYLFLLHCTPRSSWRDWQS